MERIKELREARGLRQEDVAAVLNTKRQSVSRYETNKHDPDLGTLLKLCDYFGVTSDYLLGRSEVPTQEISADEWALVRGYRELSEEGREYVRHSLALAALAHSGKNPAVSELEKGSG